MVKGPEGSVGVDWWRRGRVSAAAGTLVLLTACGGGNGHEVDAAESPRAAPVSSSKTPEPVKLVFDYLGGDDRSVPVFSGVTSAGERLKQPMYKDDDEVLAECKLTGRSVSSHPELGETDRTSNQWIRIKGDEMPEVEQYASAVYTYNYKTLLEQLQECPPK